MSMERRREYLQARIVELKEEIETCEREIEEIDSYFPMTTEREALGVIVAGCEAPISYPSIRSLLKRIEAIKVCAENALKGEAFERI
jgi:porphobilinogen deaminase